MKTEIGILGDGRFAREVELYAVRLGYRVVHFFDGTRKDCHIISGLPYCMGVGNPFVKKKILEQSGCRHFISIFDPKSIYSPSVKVGRGCVICPGVTLTLNVVLEDFVTLDINCTVGHDCSIGKYSTISPGACVSGSVWIGECCYVGTNAAIREKLFIFDEVTLGLNCGVVKSICEAGIYIGTPARLLKK